MLKSDAPGRSNLALNVELRDIITDTLRMEPSEDARASAAAGGMQPRSLRVLVDLLREPSVRADASRNIFVEKVRRP